MKLRPKSRVTRRLLAPLGGGLAALLCAEPLPVQAFTVERIAAVAGSAAHDGTFVPGVDEDRRRVFGVHADGAQGYTLHAGRGERIPATRRP